ncbi:hypothetical protein MKW98_000692 [Papaver atlanticum]|uniref:L-gulonolactone oxidase n=1 Tax=Papaver atlanticum TaxID=357466 RepID=A0AAD4T249_9MAGN|nr:hypothetical protein MKW98_000692 [Papaver atlanticum]
MAQIHSSNVATVWALCLWSVCLFLLISMAYSTPPGNPISCTSKSTEAQKSYCTISNALNAFPDRSICKFGTVVYPETEDEILSAVAMASKQKMKVKVVTRTSHSIPKLICPDGDDGLLISTLKLDRILNVDVSAMTITVEPGVLLRDLTKHAAKSGLALPAGPYWWGVTIGGLISTGAHGSGWLGNGSAVHDYVQRIRIVTPARPDEGYAKVRILQNNDPDLNAAKLSLGVLGVISQVTLRLEPLFKRSITFVEKSDSDLIQQALSFGNEHEFGEITWYPNQRKVVYRVDDRVPCHVFGNGLNNFTAFRAVPSTALAAKRSLEEIQESTKNASWQCITARTSTAASIASAYGFANDDRNAFVRYPIIGYQHRLQSAGSCLDSPNDGLLTACPADPRIKSAFYHQSAFSIGISKAKNFMLDIQKLRDLEPEAFCSVELYDGILIRYAKASKAYLGKQENSLEFDLTYYRSTNPNTPRLFEDILEEVEQMAVFKYGGKPHWGKNRNVGFIGVIKKYETAAEFLKVKKSYDPFGIFSSKWTDQILGLDQTGVTIIKEGCALEGLCICSEDIHCAPKEGYVCRPGRVYTDARVCTDINRISQNLAFTFTDM